MTPERYALAAGLLLAYAAGCSALAWGQRRRQAAARRAAAALAAPPPGGDGGTTLVAYASQSGRAEGLARASAHALHAAGRPVRLLPLAAVDAEVLRAHRQALFLVSTCGEGDPPDAGAPFAQALMAAGAALDLRTLRIGVLALGDRRYRQFCAFGRQLDGWLQGQGAVPLFERIELDGEDPRALADWRARLQGLGAAAAQADGSGPGFRPWRLLARRHLNPGSAGPPLHQLDLRPVAGALGGWSAGDLAQIRHPAEPDRPRDYSIASLPGCGRLRLLVRESRRADGRPGLLSGWLGQGLAVGDTVDLRLRTQPGFGLGDNGGRPLILIGNGSGLAGLLAHLRQRQDDGGPPCWLIFGERQAAHDHYGQDALNAARQAGVLARVDRVYSRDGGAGPRYVQDALQDAAATVQDWVRQRGAAVYVCGSRQGMAAGVDAALRGLLGEAELAALAATGRYRRDVY